MKKINKYIIMGLMVLLLPSMASAATLSYDEAKKTNDKGIFNVPIVLEVKEGEDISSVDLSCSTNDFDVSCSFKEAKGSVLLRDNKLFNYLDADGNTKFPVGKTTLGYVELTNSQSVMKTVSLEIKSNNSQASITLPSKMNVSLKAKETEHVASHDATLKSLKTSQGTMSPEFNSNTFEYTVYGIADTINSVNISWECSANSCSPSIPGNNASKKVNLKQGENRVEVVVESEAEDDADTKTYVLNIIRGESGFNSAKLASLSFGDYTLTPAFKSDVKEYNLTVPNTVTSVVNVMKFEKQDSKATESLSGFDNFVVGENKATITIDNVNGDETITYTINITRMNDTDIEVLKYKNGEITFRDSEGIQNVLSEEEFKKQYADEWEKIEDKTYKFDEDGNIVVESDQKEEETKPKKKNNTWIIIVIIVVGLIIIGVSGFFIFKKKKPNNKDDENKPDSEVKEESSNEENEEPSNDNESKEEKKDDEIDETDIEEDAIKKEKKKNESNTMEIDEALVDLMSTKKYDFKDED